MGAGSVTAAPAPPPRQAGQARGHRRSPASPRRAHAPGRRLRGGAGGGAGAGLHPGRRRAHCLGKGPGARRRCTRGPLPARRPPAQALVSDLQRFCRPRPAGMPPCSRSAPAPGGAGASPSLGRPTVPVRVPLRLVPGASRRGLSSGDAGCSGGVWRPRRPRGAAGAAGSPRCAVPGGAGRLQGAPALRRRGGPCPASPVAAAAPGPLRLHLPAALGTAPARHARAAFNLNVLSDAESSLCQPVTTLFLSLQWTAVRRGDR